MTHTSCTSASHSARSLRRLAGRSAIGALALASLPAFAQAPAASDASAGQPATGVQPTGARTAPEVGGGEIVVTGSRIARPDLQAAVPVSVVNQALIQNTGASNIQDTLAELPQVGQNISRTSSNFSTTQNGVATVNLRNLGSSRTLVLINGRRSLGIAGSSAVDVNNIPTDLVDRVEVLTGGASAVYGSEAVAGVVNFVLKDKFEGIRVRAQNTLSSRGDSQRRYGSVTAGHGFFDDRAHLVGNFSFDKDYGTRSRNRSYSATDVPNRSSYPPQGLFDTTNVNDPDAGLTFSPGTGNTFTFNPDNSVKGYESANIDGYNRNSVRLLSVPVQRYQGTLLGSFEISQAFNLYAEGQFVHTDSRNSLEASALDNVSPGSSILSFDGSPYPGIPITSPYVPEAIRQSAIANGTDVIQFRRRSNDIFDRSNVNSRNFYRGVIGAKGEIAPKWSYDISYEHSQSRDHTTSQSIYTPNYGAALNNQLVNGQVVCSDPAARAAGCVPLNIFGYNTVTPAAAAFLRRYTGPTQTVTLVDGNTVQLTNGQSADFDYLARVHQDVISGSVHGDLFSLWGSPWALAAGGEYRREKSSEVYDPFTQSGLGAGNQITNTQGRFNVKEGFVELVAPFIEDRPFIQYLGLEGAARYADYSTVGGVWSWKAGGSYAPTRDIRFRAIFSRATRAPNIGELFSSVSQTFPALTDPCDQAQGGGDGAALVGLPAQCAAVPGIAATVARRGSFAYSTSQIQTIDGLTGGNRNLKEETADTITAGAVFTPTFLRGFSLTTDYYRIKVKNAIGIIGQQISVSECLNSGNLLFCNNVIRDANGFITRVNALNLNTGSFLVSGLDVTGAYSLPLTSLMADGRLDLSVAWNHRFKQQQTPFPGADVQDEIGQADCYSCGRLGSGFKNRVFTNATISNSWISLNYRLDYLGPLRDNLDGSTAVVTRIPAYFYHNAQLKFLVGPQKKLELYVGVNNMFDKQPPQFGDTNPVTWPGTQTVADTYDLYGRMMYAGVTVNF